MAKTLTRPHVRTRTTPRHVPPSPRRSGARAIVVGLVILALLAGAGWGAVMLMRAADTPASPAQVEGGYTGDWKDTYSPAEATESATTYTGDWKDSIGADFANGAGSGYTGDWKDGFGGS
jgi:hypothetical protein